MEADAQVLVSVLSGVAIGVILFHRWIWRGVKLLVRTAAAGAFLGALSLCSGVTGLRLGVNLVNALVLGVLGLPGFGLLCAVQLF